MLLDPQEAIECPIRQILSRVGGRWSLDVMIVLDDGPSQFLEMERTIPGISRRMLAMTLRGLERDGLVTRSASGVAGDPVRYEISELGATLAKHMRALAEWSRVSKAAIETARERFDNKIETAAVYVGTISAP